MNRTVFQQKEFNALNKMPKVLLMAMVERWLREKHFEATGKDFTHEQFINACENLLKNYKKACEKLK